MAKFIHWTARVLSALMVLSIGFLLVLHAVEHDAPGLPTLTAMCLILAGLIVAWKWEAIGGALAIVGYLHLGYLNSSAAGSWPYLLCFSTGVLFVISWFFRRQMHVMPVDKECG